MFVSAFDNRLLILFGAIVRPASKWRGPAVDGLHRNIRSTSPCA
jgi:hypothetical protein